MAQFTYVLDQTVQPGAAAVLDTAISCPSRNVLHRPDSGILTLTSRVNNPCARFARYRVAYSGNIAVPTGGTVGEIQLGIAIDGEILQSSIGAATPTVVDAYFNVHNFAIIDVPVGCCYTISVENASVSATPATVPAPALTVRNLNVEVTRLA